MLQLGLRQESECSHEPDHQFVAHTVPEAQALQLLVGTVQDLLIAIVEFDDSGLALFVVDEEVLENDISGLVNNALL